MNQTIKPEVVGLPKALTQEKKLLVFAISSLHNDIDGKALLEAKKVSLTLGKINNPNAKQKPAITKA